MIPTDEQINRAAAEACGYPILSMTDDWPKTGLFISTGPRLLLRQLDEPHRQEIWQPCKDRNQMAELYSVLRSSNLRFDFEDHLCGLLFPNELFDCLEASPKLHVIAALKALDRWHDEWEIPTK